MSPITACEVKPIHATPKSNPTKTLCPTTTRLNTYRPKPQFPPPNPKPSLSFRSESKLHPILPRHLSQCPTKNILPFPATPLTLLLRPTNPPQPNTHPVLPNMALPNQCPASKLHYPYLEALSLSTFLSYSISKERESYLHLRVRDGNKFWAQYVRFWRGSACDAAVPVVCFLCDGAHD